MNLFSNVTGIVSNISWAADIAGMITSVVLGLLWYSQMVFGKIWMKQNGLNKKNPGTEAQNSMLWHLPIAFIIAANISAFCKHFDYHTGAE